LAVPWLGYDRKILAAHMKKHYLYYVDPEYKTAFCSVCGPTDIFVAKSQTEGKPRVFCLSRVQKSKETQKRRISEKRRLQPDWKPRHSLTKIDTEKMTGICAVCGPTVIQKHTQRGVTRYICATKVRPYGRRYRRLHYTPRTLSPSAHTLSSIDEDKKTAVCSQCGPVEIYVWQGKRKISRRCSNARIRRGSPAEQIRREANTRLINGYKSKHGCKRCGYNRNPDRLYLHVWNSHNKDPKIERLLKLTRDRLIQELEKSDVLCAICRSLLHENFRIDRLSSEIPIQFSQL